MTQSKGKSLIEVCCNVGSGFVFSLLIWECVIEPFIEVRETFSCNLLITGIYTVISVTRGFIWRRVFESGKINS